MINDDLYDLLIEMDIKKKRQWWLCITSEREVTYLTIMDSLSKSLLQEECRYRKEISLKNIKKDVFDMGKSCYFCRNKALSSQQISFLKSII
jgi:hypothetical protein